jgi:hypothetical protein
MKMKKLILFGVFLFSLNAGFGQKISKLEDFVDPDSMVIRVDKIQVGKENKELATELSYDFKHQYPYFILSKNITTGDTIKFSVQTFPDTGMIYVYHLDAVNSIRLLDTLVIDDAMHHLPDSLKPAYQMVASTAGLERFVFLYAKEEVPNIARILKGIELTYGSFILRHNGLFGDQILEPKMDWRMMEKMPGFSFEKKLLKMENKWLLPLIIGYEVKDK